MLNVRVVLVEQVWRENMFIGVGTQDGGDPRQGGEKGERTKEKYRSERGEKEGGRATVVRESRVEEGTLMKK